ncbi:MAG: hypothetical protein RR394_09645 [Oscillospiraceae bacterium]
MDAAIKTALSTAFGSVKTDVLAVIVTALPIGLAIFAAFFGIKKGISFFRSISKG